MGSIFCYFFCWVWWVLYPAKLCFQAIFFLPSSKCLKSVLRLGFQALCHIFDMISLNTMDVFLFFCWLKKILGFLFTITFINFTTQRLKISDFKLHTTIKIIYLFQNKVLHLFCGHPNVLIVFLLIHNCLVCHCFDAGSDLSPPPYCLCTCVLETDSQNLRIGKISK